MSAATQGRAPGLIDTVKSLLGLRAPKGPAAPAPAPIPPGPALPYTEAQRRELERLLARLLAKKPLITSGKLHLAGFDNIRDRLGLRWPVLRETVYKIAQDVIRAHLSAGDVYLRYRDDTYLFVLAQASLDEGAMRAQRISDEIGRRLEGLDSEALNVIQVDARVGDVETRSLAGKSLPDAMDVVAGAAQEHAHPRARAAMAALKAPKCNYIPLWNIRGHGLSMYLCELDDKAGRTPLDRDLDTLRAAKAELRRMEETGRDFTLVVPVRHGTLFNTDSSQKYQMLYRDLPEAHRKNVVFLVTQYMEGLPENTAYWFIPALKTVCRQVYAEMALRGKGGLGALKSRGIDGLCVTVSPDADEAVTLGHLRGFSEQGRQAAFPEIIVLGLPSLSLATSASCMGFTGIGGPAIHGAVDAPDKSHKFRYAEIFAGGA